MQNWLLPSKISGPIRKNYLKQLLIFLFFNPELTLNSNDGSGFKLDLFPTTKRVHVKRELFDCVVV